MNVVIVSAASIEFISEARSGQRHVVMMQGNAQTALHSTCAATRSTPGTYNLAPRPQFFSWRWAQPL